MRFIDRLNVLAAPHGNDITFNNWPAFFTVVRRKPFLSLYRSAVSHSGHLITRSLATLNCSVWERIGDVWDVTAGLTDMQGV